MVLLKRIKMILMISLSSKIVEQQQQMDDTRYKTCRKGRLDERVWLFCQRKWIKQRTSFHKFNNDTLRISDAKQRNKPRQTNFTKVTTHFSPFFVPEKYVSIIIPISRSTKRPPDHTNTHKHAYARRNREKSACDFFSRVTHADKLW